MHKAGDLAQGALDIARREAGSSRPEPPAPHVDPKFKFNLLMLADMYSSFQSTPTFVANYWGHLVVNGRLPLSDVLSAIEQCPFIYPDWMPTPGQIESLAREKLTKEEIRKAKNSLAKGDVCSLPWIVERVALQRKQRAADSVKMLAAPEKAWDDCGMDEVTGKQFFADVQKMLDNVKPMVVDDRYKKRRSQ